MNRVTHSSLALKHYWECSTKPLWRNNGNTTDIIDFFDLRCDLEWWQSRHICSRGMRHGQWLLTTRERCNLNDEFPSRYIIKLIALQDGYMSASALSQAISKNITQSWGVHIRPCMLFERGKIALCVLDKIQMLQCTIYSIAINIFLCSVLAMKVN